MKINDQDTLELGVLFKRGELNRQLLKLPQPKQRYEHNWKDEHGTERDLLSPVFYEPLEYTIGLYLFADNIEELTNRRSALLSIISAPGGFVLYNSMLDRNFRLYYTSNQGFNDLTPLFKNGKLYCEVTINVVNNHDAVEVIERLADSEGNIYDPNEEQIWVMDERRVF